MMSCLFYPPRQNDTFPTVNELLISFSLVELRRPKKWREALRGLLLLEVGLSARSLEDFLVLPFT